MNISLTMVLDAIGGPLREWLDSIENKKRYKWVQARRKRQRRSDALKLIKLYKTKHQKYLKDRKRVVELLKKRGQLLPSQYY